VGPGVPGREDDARDAPRSQHRSSGGRVRPARGLVLRWSSPELIVRRRVMVARYSCRPRFRAARRPERGTISFRTRRGKGRPQGSGLGVPASWRFTPSQPAGHPRRSRPIGVLGVVAVQALPGRPLDVRTSLILVGTPQRAAVRSNAVRARERPPGPV